MYKISFFIFRLQRFEKTNEMLANCNQLSITRLKDATNDFKKHTALLVDMKKDLDYILKKIKTIKTKLNQQYPDAYSGNNYKDFLIEISCRSF